jgi:hypothetical protein
MSSCVANLPTHLRYVSMSSRLPRLLNSLLSSYRPRNLILYGISPGPKELDSDQLQFFMKDYVDDLLRLYDEGIIIKTSKYPDGQLQLYLCLRHNVNDLLFRATCTCNSRCSMLRPSSDVQGLWIW